MSMEESARRIIQTQAGPLDLSNPTTHFYYTRERVRALMEKEGSKYSRPLTYKYVAYRLHIDCRTAKRHIAAIIKEQ
jgi:hypothetical protein